MRIKLLLKGLNYITKNNHVLLYMSMNKYKKIDLINIATKNNIPIKNRQKKIKTKAELFDSLKNFNKYVTGSEYYNGNIQIKFKKYLTSSKKSLDVHICFDEIDVCIYGTRIK